MFILDLPLVLVSCLFKSQWKVIYFYLIYSLQGFIISIYYSYYNFPPLFSLEKKTVLQAVGTPHQWKCFRENWTQLFSRDDLG